MYRPNTNNLMFSLFTNIKEVDFSCTESSGQVQVSMLSICTPIITKVLRYNDHDICRQF